MLNIVRKTHSHYFGFSLIELLVVIGIISILVGLLLPAVQAAREAARRAQCCNNLYQMGLAVLQHESAKQYYPTGGWGSLWVGDPNRGADEDQPGGWVYNILPYLEQQAVHDMGMGTDATAREIQAVEMIGTKIPNVNCPSRRTDGLYKHSSKRNSSLYNAASQPEMEARSDYAANAGDCRLVTGAGPRRLNDPDFKWPDPKKLTGISFFRSKVRAADVTDGVSNTYLIGEKWLSIEHYFDGESYGDDNSLYEGAAHDIHRWVAESSEKPWPPLPDNTTSTDNDESLSGRFGSCHADVWNVALCDGSVHTVSLSVDAEVHRRYGCRNDGKPTNGTIVQ